MEIELSPLFRKNFRQRANRRIEKLFEERLRVFRKNPHDPALRNHVPAYDREGQRSFSLTSDEGPDDFRVIFRRIGRRKYLLVDFGRHDQLYRPWRRKAK